MTVFDYLGRQPTGMERRRRQPRVKKIFVQEGVLVTIDNNCLRTRAAAGPAFVFPVWLEICVPGIERTV